MNTFKETFEKNKAVFIVLSLAIVIIILYLLNRATNTIPQVAPKVPSTPTITASQQANATPSVVARSEVSDYGIFMKDQPGLISQLNKMGVWGKTYNSSGQKDTKPLSQFVVILTDKKQKYEMDQNANKDILFTVGLNFLQDIVMVNLNIPPSVLAQKNSSQTADIAVLYAAFLMNHPITAKPKDAEIKQFISLLQDFVNSRQSFFQVTKLSTTIFPSPTK